jgi:hypothetical protein
MLGLDRVPAEACGCEWMGAGWAEEGATEADETSAVEVQGADLIRAGRRVVSTQVARLRDCRAQRGGQACIQDAGSSGWRSSG